MNISIPHNELTAAAQKGAEPFVLLIMKRIAEAVGGELNAEALQELNSQQLTLWAYFILRDELMDGGFVQLIHNGYGPFFFRNPFAKAMRQWGLGELSKIINKAQKLYAQYGDEIANDCTSEEFMALFEQYPKFDDLDDAFVESEEDFTALVAQYVDEHLDTFINIQNNG